MCSSSSLESVVTVEDERQNDSSLKPSSTNTLRVSGSNGSGAFTSYVRKRGEPDGRTASDASTQITKVNFLNLYIIHFFARINYKHFIYYINHIYIEFNWSIDYAYDIESQIRWY